MGHMCQKTSNPFKVNATKFQADKKPFHDFKLLCDAGEMISTSPQNHNPQETPDFLQIIHFDVLQDQPLDLSFNKPLWNTEKKI